MSEHRIVLTGASGMLGRAILKQLERREDVLVLALYRGKSPAKSTKNVEPRIVTFDRKDEVRRTLEDFRPTIFIHTAATGMQHPRPDVSMLMKINAELPEELARTVNETSDCHFVHVSSGLAYKDQGRPLREEDPLETSHPYGASKAEAEKRLQLLSHGPNFSLTIFRPFSFTGEGDFGSRLFPSLLLSAVERRPFAMSTGDQVRDHASVNDIARGIIAGALAHPAASPFIFNLGSGDTRPLRELVGAVVAELGLKVELLFGAKPYSPGESMFAVADFTRARSQLKWQPQESVAKAVWDLAQKSFPSLNLMKPSTDDKPS